MNLFPYDSKFDFMRLRKVSIGLAVALFVIAIGALVTRGLNFALDFTGGTVVELKFDKEADVGLLEQHGIVTSLPQSVQPHAPGPPAFIDFGPCQRR